MSNASTRYINQVKIMLNLSTSTNSIFDKNFGYTSIADAGLGESLDNLFQRRETLLSTQANEFENSDLSYITSSGDLAQRDIAGKSSPTDFTQQLRPAQSQYAGSGYDRLTGAGNSQPLVGTVEGAIADSAQPLDVADANQFSSNDALSFNASNNSWRINEGTLRADRFAVDGRYQYNVFSGNGNVDFGNQRYDWIDLSGVHSQHVVDQGLMKLNIGDGGGARMFDALKFSNGSYVFFESVEKVAFSNGVLNLSVTPNDTYFNQQWNLHMIGAHTAWRFTKGNDDVLVGVQDTGLGMDSSGRIHSDLDADETWSFSGNVRDDFFRNVPDRSYGSKSSSHGTEVQGIIAAESNNGQGISGINWESDVVAIDVLDGNRGDQTPTVATANMINHARSLGKKLVINMSFGGSGPIDPQLERLIASSQGDALFVIAAGNDGRGSLSNPASLAAKYSNVVAVGASLGTRTGSGWPVAPGTKASYSNYGHGISLTAPSEVITTGASPRGFGYSPKFNGTSAAAPHVAGVASLVWSVNDKLSAGTVKQVLMQTATDLGARGYDRVYGSGIVNADAAVRRAMAMS